jgi:hypothetical protein
VARGRAPKNIEPNGPRPIGERARDTMTIGNRPRPEVIAGKTASGVCCAEDDLADVAAVGGRLLFCPSDALGGPERRSATNGNSTVARNSTVAFASIASGAERHDLGQPTGGSGSTRRASP